MENQLKCFLVLSLKEMALRRTAVFLWSGADVLESVSKFQFDIFAFDNAAEEDAGWQDSVEDRVINKVMKLHLPESLRKQMIEIVKPIGLDVREWVDYHEDYFLHSFDQRNPVDLTKLCLTSAGTINRRKTAEELVCSDVLEICRRYILACEYCLEDDIPLLWEKLPEWMKGACKRKVSKPLLGNCWPYILRGELSELEQSLLGTSDRNPFTFYQCAFEYSVKNGDETAAGYFFLKLSCEEREDSLVRTAHDVLTDITNIHDFEYRDKFPGEKFSRLLFLLSFMNPEQRMKIFASRPIDVLFSFLEWPWQDLFLENADLFWALLPRSSYGDLLDMMNDRYTKSEFYIPKLFQELFAQSPLGFKKAFVDEIPGFNLIRSCNFMNQLFDSDDSETVGVIFRNLDATDRIKFFFHRNILEQLFDCVVEGRWPVVTVCLREVTLSEADKEKLKGAFTEFLKRYDTEEVDQGGRDSKKFLELLNHSDAGAGRVNNNKRKLEE